MKQVFDLERNMRLMTTFKFSFPLILLLAAIVLPAAAQQNGSPPVKGMASTVGLYVYPQKNQSATQQLTDESQCYENAKTQTGFNPDAATHGSSTQTQNSNTNQHGAAKGAARGAAISGATGGDPGEGAARGAIIGSARSRRKGKQQEEQAQKQTDASKTQQQQNMDNFKRSMSACLDAREYSVH